MGVKVPKNQVLWTRYTDAKGKNTWLITSDPARIRWNLYKAEGDTLRKVKTADSPAEFREEIGMPV